jgi:hypothetical protein
MSSGSTQIDRMYVSLCLLPAKKTTEIRVAAFTERLAVVLHIARPTRSTTRGRGYWKLHVSLIQDQQICAAMKQEWDIRKKIRP